MMPDEEKDDAAEVQEPVSPDKGIKIPNLSPERLKNLIKPDDASPIPSTETVAPTPTPTPPSQEATVEVNGQKVPVSEVAKWKEAHDNRAAWQAKNTQEAQQLSADRAQLEKDVASLLTNQVPVASASPTPTAPATSAGDDRIARLEQEFAVRRLHDEVSVMKQEHGAFDENALFKVMVDEGITNPHTAYQILLGREQLVNRNRQTADEAAAGLTRKAAGIGSTSASITPTEPVLKEKGFAATTRRLAQNPEVRRKLVTSDY